MSDRITPVDPRNKNRSATSNTSEFREFMGAQWAEFDPQNRELLDAARAASDRRKRVSAAFPGERLIVPAGDPKVRSNDDDYPYRAHSSFAYLTGWGANSEAGSVLVFEPTGLSGHNVTLYFRATADRTSDEFYANAQIGEFWVGPRPTLDEVAVMLGLVTASLSTFTSVIKQIADANESDPPTLIIRQGCPSITADVTHARTRTKTQAELSLVRDALLDRTIDEFRLVKDDYEISQMRAAIEATSRGFDDIRDCLPRSVGQARGERVIEGTFTARARLEGNATGYTTIAAAGPNATILHWNQNDGFVRHGDLVLVDAGVEMCSYYTADITRTFPVNGRFNELQRKIYNAVLEAADAAFAVAKPGAIFRDLHAAATAVIAKYTEEWGFLPAGELDESGSKHNYHRRYMIHGTSHHLGLDVHDCNAARREMYMDGVLKPGMIFTIEPGLYFHSNDLSVPEEFRGIGIRIEDNILITDTGAENLSAGIARTADEIEAWLAAAQ